MWFCQYNQHWELWVISAYDQVLQHEMLSLSSQLHWTTANIKLQLTSNSIQLSNLQSAILSSPVGTVTLPKHSAVTEVAEFCKHQHYWESWVISTYNEGRYHHSAPSFIKLPQTSKAQVTSISMELVSNCTLAKKHQCVHPRRPWLNLPPDV